MKSFAPFRIGLFVTLALHLCGVPAMADSTCQEIEFSGGPDIRMRADTVRSVNAVLEWPKKRIFSVSVALPSSGAVAGAEQLKSIVLMPANTIEATPVCSKVSEHQMRCDQLLADRLGMSIVINHTLDHPEAFSQRIADYVTEQVICDP